MQAGYVADYEAIERDLPGWEVPWLANMREASLERFAELGFPGPRNEDWKYTNVRPLERPRFHPGQLDERVDEASLMPYLLGGQSACRLVFVNGHFSPRLSMSKELPSGVTVTGLAETIEHNPELLEEYLSDSVERTADGFAALNMALMSDGACVRIGRGVALERPIHLLFVHSGDQETAVHLRNLVVLEEGAQASLVESYVALEDGRFMTNVATEAVVGANAGLDHYKLAMENENTYHIANTHARVDRDGRYFNHNITTGGRLVRNDLRSELRAEGADCELNGLSLLRGRQHVDNHTRIDHWKPHCTSREWYKGVLDDHSRSVFTGRVVVHPNAQKTDAQQANNNLLLSDNAEADSRPQLEIYADDVKCSHGATAGQIDEEALFYLRSRAVGESAARQLLIYAFASDIVDRMRLPALQKQVQNRLTGRLLSGQALEGLV